MLWRPSIETFYLSLYIPEPIALLAVDPMPIYCASNFLLLHLPYVLPVRLVVQSRHAHARGLFQKARTTKVFFQHYQFTYQPHSVWCPEARYNAHLPFRKSSL